MLGQIPPIFKVVAVAQPSPTAIKQGDSTMPLITLGNSSAHLNTPAQKFGQEDDINVISVMRTAKLGPALV